MIEGTIPPNWTDLVQCSSQSGAPHNIDLKDTFFTPDLEEDSRETPIHMPRVALENNNNTLMSLQSQPHAQEILTSKGLSVSEVNKRPASEVDQNKLD